MHRFSSPALALSRQQGERQQMVTSVNFTSDCTPLEDLIMCGLHALLLKLYINTSLCHWYSYSGLQVESLHI